MKRVLTSLLMLALLAVSPMLRGQTRVRVGPPFADHMVLPHDAPILLYGSGCPGGDTVKVAIAGQSAWARSDWRGNWEVPLKPMKPGGPYQLLIEIGGAGPLVISSAATAQGGAEWNDVLIGEVVLASTLEAEGSNTPTLEKALPHPFAFVRVLAAARENRPPSWSFASQNVAPVGAEAIFRVAAARAVRLGMPVGVIESNRGPLCISPAGCPAVPRSTSSP